MIAKEELRLSLKKRLLQIPLERKEKASTLLENHPFPRGIIGSFASFREEINTKPLNLLLARRGSLALPRVDKEHLVFYLVHDIERELSPSSLGILEPIPTLCKPALHIDMILVPGLAFDKEHYRLGYGKGYYDRLLAKSSAMSIGVGFIEQLSDRLPHESHDVKLNQIKLF